MAHACPDRWLTPHRTGGSAASEYSHVTLSLNDSPWDRPADMEIWNSPDGINWKQLDVTTEDGENYYFAQTDCRYLKFVLGPGCEGAEANWSIYEISLYGEAGPLTGESAGTNSDQAVTHTSP